MNWPFCVLFVCYLGGDMLIVEWSSFVIVYQEIFNTKMEAMQREKQIKNWKSNIRIKELIMRSSSW